MSQSKERVQAKPAERLLRRFEHWRNHYLGEEGERTKEKANRFALRQCLLPAQLDKAGVSLEELKNNLSEVVGILSECAGEHLINLALKYKEHLPTRLDYSDPRAKMIINKVLETTDQKA